MKYGSELKKREDNQTTSIIYKEEPSDAGHVWIERVENKKDAIYSRPVGMIQHTFKGYLGVGQYEEKTFPTFSEAKTYIIEQEECGVFGI